MNTGSKEQTFLSWTRRNWRESETRKSALCFRASIYINVYRVGTLKNRPLDGAPRPKVNKLESEI
jgi:hypothetical protein